MMTYSVPELLLVGSAQTVIKGVDDSLEGPDFCANPDTTPISDYLELW